MSKTFQLKDQAIAVAASTNDQHLKQLSEIIQQLCMEIDGVKKPLTMLTVKLVGRNEFELTSDPSKENDRRVTIAMRLHCSIRDLLWLTALVAIAIGWWCDHRFVAQQLNFCIEALDQHRKNWNNCKQNQASKLTLCVIVSPAQKRMPLGPGAMPRSMPIGVSIRAHTVVAGESSPKPLRSIGVGLIVDSHRANRFHLSSPVFVFDWIIHDPRSKLP